MRIKNLHAVLEVGPEGVLGPIIYRIKYKTRKDNFVIGRHLTIEEVHALYPGFAVSNSFSIEKMWD